MRACFSRYFNISYNFLNYVWEQRCLKLNTQRLISQPIHTFLSWSRSCLQPCIWWWQATASPLYGMLQQQGCCGCTQRMITLTNACTSSALVSSVCTMVFWHRNEKRVLNFHVLVLYYLLPMLGSKISDSFLESALTTDVLQFVFILFSVFSFCSSREEAVTQVQLNTGIFFLKRENINKIHLVQAKRL